MEDVICWMDIEKNVALKEIVWNVKPYKELTYLEIQIYRFQKVYHFINDYFSLEDVFASCFFSIDFFYMYIHNRKFNAEFNKLIKTVGHRACFFKKWSWTHLCQQVWLYLDIFIFSLIKSLSCNKTLKMLGL